MTFKSGVAMRVEQVAMSRSIVLTFKNGIFAAYTIIYDTP